MTKPANAHEGEAIKAMLDGNGKTAADLARAMGISAQALGRTLKKPTVGNRSQARIHVGLAKLGIEPPAPQVFVLGGDISELKGFIARVNRSDLPLIVRMLGSDPGTRIRLMDFADGILAATADLPTR